MGDGVTVEDEGAEIWQSGDGDAMEIVIGQVERFEGKDAVGGGFER